MRSELAKPLCIFRNGEDGPDGGRIRGQLALIIVSSIGAITNPGQNGQLPASARS